MQHLTIAELEVQPTNLPIWALNGSAYVREIADVLISIPKLNGARSDSLKMPATWLPLCLTEQISRSQLLAAAEFRQAVNSGLVVLISEEDAAQILQREGAQAEKDRLRENETRVRDAMASRGLHTDEVSIIGGIDVVTTPGAAGQQLPPANEMDPGFVIFFDSLVLKTDIETLNAIRTRGRFRRPELQHMAVHMIEKPKSTEYVRSFLK